MGKEPQPRHGVGQRGMVGHKEHLRQAPVTDHAQHGGQQAQTGKAQHDRSVDADFELFHSGYLYLTLVNFNLPLHAFLPLNAFFTN